MLRAVVGLLIAITILTAALCAGSFFVPLGAARQHEYRTRPGIYAPGSDLTFISAWAAFINDGTFYYERGAWGPQLSDMDQVSSSSATGMLPLVKPGPFPPIPLLNPVYRDSLTWDSATQAPRPYNGTLRSFPFYILVLITAAGALGLQVVRRRKQRAP